MNPQDVNGAYCMACYRARPYLKATGHIGNCDAQRCKNPSCGKLAILWATLTKDDGGALAQQCKDVDAKIKAQRFIDTHFEIIKIGGQ